MKTILFACAENKKRSQMAEAIFNDLAKGINWAAQSGGAFPAEKIDPLTIRVLKELDIEIANQKPKKVTDEMLKNADMIISFGCLVPAMFPKEKFREWIIDDPKTLDDFRRVRDELREKIRKLIDEIK